MIERESSRRTRAERAARQAALRKRVIVWGLVMVVLLGLLVAAKPSYRALKARRANELAAEAETMVNAGRWTEAASKYRAALQLSPLGYRPLTGAARLAMRGGRPEATDLWAQVLRLPDATVSDRQEYAALLLQRDAIEPVQKIIEDLLRINPDSKALSLAAQYSSKTRNEEKAVQFARLAAERAENDSATRFQLADVLAKSGDVAKRKEARQVLWSLTNKDAPWKKAAIKALARAPELSVEEEQRVLVALHEMPERDVVSDLPAAELKLKLQPDREAQVFEEAIAQWSTGETRELAELAHWLNLHKQSERVLALLPTERAVTSEALLLSRLDALADLQQWKEIDTLLERKDLTLDPSVTESLRARNALNQGASLDAELRWERALVLASGDPNKLRFVGNFAEQSRATEVALKAFDQLTKFPEHAAFAQRGRQRLIEQSGDATAARTVAERLVTVAPDDVNAQAELVYLNLLLGVDVQANLEQAKELAAKFPARLSFRVTAALGYLREHDPAHALAQFDGPAPIEWPRTPPGWRAVYIAVLAANERTNEARPLLASLPLDRLNKEERELIAAEAPREE